MLNAMLCPPNAILFVFDPTNKDVQIPPYINGELTASTASCVSIGTQADVDGDTAISLSLGGAAPAGLQKVFCDVIVVPNGKVAVVTSQFQRVLELEISTGVVEVNIWVDELHNPSNIAVILESIA